jgi:anti-sigma-K factor RskA
MTWDKDVQRTDWHAWDADLTRAEDATQNLHNLAVFWLVVPIALAIGAVVLETR